MMCLSTEKIMKWLEINQTFLFPKSIGSKVHLEGLKRTGKVYLLVTLPLIVAAVYECWKCS